MRVGLPARAVSILLLLALAAGCREEGAIEVASLGFEGVTAIDEGDLRRALATQPSDRLPWGRRRFFDRDRFEADLRRIPAFYADRGYPAARVASFDVDLNEDQDRVRLTVVIDEGEPLLVEEVELVGFQALPEAHRAELRDAAEALSGRPRDRLRLGVVRELALDELRDHGYPYASIDVQERPGAAPNRVGVSFVAVPGPAAFFGPIEVVGNRTVDDDVIRRQLTYRPGEPFRLSELRGSQRNLFRVELFEFVNVEAAGTEGQPAEVPTRVTVTEGKHRRVTLGMGYGTEERARGEIQWRHVNFLGGARVAGVQGRWSALDRGVRLNFTEPYFFHPKITFGLSGQRWFTDEPLYKLDTTGGRASVTWRHEDRGPIGRVPGTTTVSLGYQHEQDAFAIANEALLDLTLRETLIDLRLDPRTGEGSGILSAIQLDARRTTVANLLDARAGYVVSLHLEQAGFWLPGTANYYEVAGEGRHYLSLGRRAVVAHRLRAAWIDTPREDLLGNVPFFKRYFLGGSQSVRGWGRFQVAPLSGSGLPIGGHSMLEATSEVRLPLAGNFGSVIFLDAGNVWTDPWTMRLGDLRYAVGPGLRYLTPIGPVRLDIGYQLNPIAGLLVDGEPERRRWRVHFSIGQAF